MTKVYRLVDTALADDAFSGEGARLNGGRWNPPGYAVVYASESRALAVLEALVHLTVEAQSMDFLLYEITLPKRTCLHRFEKHLASHRSAALPSGEAAGRSWLEDGTTLALVVPSVIVPQEANYVLNVRHSQFARLRIAEPEPFSLDERLWQRGSTG